MMTGRIAADVLGDMIVADGAYKQDATTLEAHVSQAFLVGTTSASLNDDLVDRLLRYADILSHSTSEQYREASYTLIALLREYQELVGLSERSTNRVAAVAAAVLVELGNFPGLRTLANGSEVEFTLPMSRGILRAAKEVVQATKHGKQTLTDTQYQITERMRGEDYFSFSGPTSLGKSFILKDAIYDIVRRPDLDQHCVVVLVPTKALIGQTAADLRSLLQDVPEVNVATFPSLPRFLRRTYPRTIFVFTPERLLRYLADAKRDIDYLIIDEAQKVISKKDARSSIYYHAIVEVTRRYATKLIFASPSIQNPELFLELFGKATNGALAVMERTVAQQRYFVDLIDRKQYYLSGSDADQREMDRPPTARTPIELVTSLSGARKSIVYINSSAKSADFAIELAATLPEVQDEMIDKLIKFVKEHIHKDYYLVKTLKHGVAFHHGKMPQEVREKVEALFSDPDSRLQFVVCTSTLLEGVNLPAKNIFVLNDTHGPSGFGKIDFENLAGRAGRLTYDFSGNVVCVRHEPGAWNQTTRDLIPRGTPITAESFLVNPGRKTKDFTDIGKVLQGKPLASGTSNDAKRAVEQYSSILLLHLLGKQQTPLRTLFMEKVTDGSKILDKAASEFTGSVEVLRRSPGILPKYQNLVWDSLVMGVDGPLIPADTEELNYELFERVLVRLGALYDWITTESGGLDPLVPSTEPGYSKRVRYWAMLMSYWVKGDPLVLVIKRTIAYHAKQGTITYRDFNKSPYPIDEPFDANSAKHINIIIESMMRDLETGLRFKIISYLENYHDLSVQALGVNNAGFNVAKLVEYGSSDSKVINLQEVGFSRAVALELLDKHGSLLTFTANDELDAVDVESLLSIAELDGDVRDEVENILRKSPQQEVPT
ncbi:DEAD/DEAH box helicase [Microbacterium sp. CBA3102]|uniref:DEAD/DEAH box helicase n=1 Tax=Microbacterium sp. CBA3102 TaxID=2603598 RepID=UPI0011BB4284|nr:DEAD/DEAH box helicase [Microbacterium sp. CBA3102]QEA29480.1 DEAD/DEAH box helicase [Microbacterium sp. CBA3102]